MGAPQIMSNHLPGGQIALSFANIDCVMLYVMLIWIILKSGINNGEHPYWNKYLFFNQREAAPRYGTMFVTHRDVEVRICHEPEIFTKRAESLWTFF